MNAFFESAFKQLTDHKPFRWQCRLYRRMVAGDIPDCCDLPTGLGKTSVMTIWLIARAHNPGLPRRLVYVVDRRAVVDQATAEADNLQRRLRGNPELAALAQALPLDGKAELPVSTLRGRFVDNRSWLEDPARPAIVVGTVDMIGSRLLFSGYGVAPRTRPYHAALLGADTLVVLDEAHLCPPFEALLRTIAEDARGVFSPGADRGQRLVPPFRLLSLSATGREAEGPRPGAVFRLGPEDCEDPTVRTRLAAPKRLSFEVLDDARKLVVALADRARVLGEGPARVLVYCHSRDQAVEVKTQIDKWFKKERREYASELLVGARRVHERERLAAWLTEHGLLGTTEGTPERPTFLIATSAGEVGVDLDADHMVCDLVEWERMVQRLGRVNRRGEKQSRVEIIAASRKDDEPERLERLRAPLDLLPADEDGRRDASPGALVALKNRAAADLRLKSAVDAATTPAPLRPALTRALVDTWSMTSLEEHTGRPEIQPWLRGWETEEPQTTLAWRRWLPWREDLDAPISHEVERFFRAGPVHLREILETETHRVVDLLTRRAAAVMKAAQEAEGAAHGPALELTAPALLVLRRDGHLSQGLS